MCKFRLWKCKFDFLHYRTKTSVLYKIRRNKEGKKNINCVQNIIRARHFRGLRGSKGAKERGGGVKNTYQLPITQTWKFITSPLSKSCIFISLEHSTSEITIFLVKTVDSASKTIKLKKYNFSIAQINSSWYTVFDFFVNI